MARTLTLHSPAKLNLTLRVGGRQPSGFHDVRTVLQSIAIGDKLTVTGRRGPFALDVRGRGVPADRTNLVWRAAEALWRRAGRPGEPRDAHIRLAKSIPAGAGMGGGSANAAATLSALNVVWGLDRSRADLMALAGELGSDVPYFLCGGTAMGTGRGEEIYPLEDAPRLGVVVIKPSFSVSTGDAYAWLDADREAGAESRRRPPRSVDLGWASGELTVDNDLEAPVARRHPDIAVMVDACLSQGARVAAMTGSGSAVFGLFDGTAAARAARKLQRPDWLVMVTRTLSRRESGRWMGL